MKQKNKNKNFKPDLDMYQAMGLSPEVISYGENILEELKERFAAIDRVAEYNQLKVLKAMQEAKVSEACLSGTTGYGYNDLGRDTLEEVIGIRPSKGSLAEYGITYRQVDLLKDGSFDYEGIRQAVNGRTRLVTIQRSKGYQTRPTLSVSAIGELISFLKDLKPDLICMVDNCYGEFGRTWSSAP